MWERFLMPDDFIVDGKEVHIRGRGNCYTCGIGFEGKPMEAFAAMKKHEKDSGHRVWEFGD